jgi:hypothetical protein
MQPVSQAKDDCPQGISENTEIPLKNIWLIEFNKSSDTLPGTEGPKTAKSWIEHLLLTLIEERLLVVKPHEQKDALEARGQARVSAQGQDGTAPPRDEVLLGFSQQPHAVCVISDEWTLVNGVENKVAVEQR